MLSRALILATVMLLIGGLAATPVRAQVQNLEAGKSPSQIFAGTCNACHKSPRGLLKTVPPGSLQGFLRQHYTTSSDMASLLAGFLIANGAADTRQVGTRPTEQPKDARPAAAATPGQLDRFGRPIRPAAPAQEPLKPAADGQPPAQAALTEGPDGRKSSAKQKLGKRGKPDEPPKHDAAKDAARDEPAKGEAAKEEAKDDAKDDASKDVAPKPSGEGPSQSAKVDAPTENVEPPALRPDPVPPVTPAPPSTPAVSAAVSNGAVEATSPPAATTPVVPAEPPSVVVVPPSVTAAAPSLPPVPPAGPPAPPISQ